MYYLCTAIQNQAFFVYTIFLDMQTFRTDEKCTAKVAAIIMDASVRTAERYMRALRKDRGYAAYAFVSVGEFVSHYARRCGYYADRVRVAPTAKFVGTTGTM